MIGVVFLFLRNVTFQTYIEKEEQQQIESQIKVSKVKSSMHQMVLEKEPDNEKEEELLMLIRPILSNLYELAPILSTDDWRSKLVLQNEILINTVEYKEAGGENPLTYGEISRIFALNTKLLDENIMPEHDRYSIALPNFMKRVVDIYIGLGAIGVLIILIGEVLAGEYESRSVNLLFTQPLKRTYIILSKFWSSVILYLFTMAILILTTFGVGLIFGERGTFDYPILIENNNTIEFITVFDYMAQGLVVMSTTVVLVISLYLLFSLLFKHTLSTLFVLLGTLLGSYVLTSFISWGQFAWVNPFQYVLPAKTILFQNDHVWYQGIPAVLISTIVFYLIASQKIKSSYID